MRCNASFYHQGLVFPLFLFDSAYVLETIRLAVQSVPGKWGVAHTTQATSQHAVFHGKVYLCLPWIYWVSRESPQPGHRAHSAAHCDVACWNLCQEMYLLGAYEWCISWGVTFFFCFYTRKLVFPNPHVESVLCVFNRVLVSTVAIASSHQTFTVKSNLPFASICPAMFWPYYIGVEIVEGQVEIRRTRSSNVF